MRILAIVGSPHRGNSLEITERIEQKLTQFDDVTFETADLRRVDLQPCRGFRIMQPSYRRVKEMSPVDYRHWHEKGWLDDETRYYHDNVRGNRLKDLVARLIGWFTGRQIDKAMAKMA
jgi:hypothetical protein